MGAVIWNVKWGDDSCFESHATQPRATLIDCCSGGFMHWRQGGDSAQMPNHLENLTIWNFNATNVQTDPDIDKEDRKSTRLNSSHANISYAVFCLKKKKNNNRRHLSTNYTHIS